MKEVEKLQEKREKRRLQQQELREKKAQVRPGSDCFNHAHVLGEHCSDWLHFFVLWSVIAGGGCHST